jgi:hypothetical protein
MMRILRPLCILAALAAFPMDAAAQMEFAGIPWGTSPRQTADRLQAMGYQLRGVDQDGDWVFRAPDGAEVVAMMDSAGVVAVDLRWYDKPEQFPLRVQVLLDSLTDAFGPPLNKEEGSGAWHRHPDDGWAHLLLRRPTGGLDSMLFMAFTRPGGNTRETDRRGALADERRARLREQGPDPVAVGGWLELWSELWRTTLVDTASVGVLPNGVYRTRILVRLQEPGRLENGMRYDALISEVEIDCPGRRWRTRRAIPLFYEVPLAVTDVPEADREWIRPEPGGVDAYVIKESCIALARQR